MLDLEWVISYNGGEYFTDKEEVTMSAWLKAGLVGIAILIVLNLIGLIPFLGCITAPLSLTAYIVVGVLAASYMPPKRETGTAAGQGALAAVVA